MLIHEIAKKCGTTKKTVQYYVEERLILPRVLGNGYKDFSEEDMRRLKRIVLYRKLGLGLGEIKGVLEDPRELTAVLHQRTLELEREKVKQALLKRIEAGEEPEALEEEIRHIDSNTIIIKKLVELFPGCYGKLISLNFAGYLTGELETEEQLEAFHQIIDFFDNVPDLDLPEELQSYLDEASALYSSVEGEEILDEIFRKKQEAIRDIETFVKNNRGSLDAYQKLRQTETFTSSPAFRLMEFLKGFCANSGYYEVFIPAMRRLSPLYDAYYEQMLRANERLIEIYPQYSAL